MPYTAVEPYSGQNRTARFLVTHLQGKARGATLVLFRWIGPSLRTLSRLDVGFRQVYELHAAGLSYAQIAERRRADALEALDRARLRIEILQPLSVKLPPAAGTKRQSYEVGRSVSESTPSVSKRRTCRGAFAFSRAERSSAASPP